MEKSDVDIINKMGETLDMSLYETLTYKGQMFLKNNVRFSTNKPFVELFNNYLNRHDILYPSKIIGAQLAVKLTSEKYNKIIYVFGEVHQEYDENKCDDGITFRISEFLDYLFKTTPVPIDFFLETAPHMKSENVEEKDIRKLRNMVYDCVKKDKEKCPYDCVRIHYVDVRFTENFPDLRFKKENKLADILLQVKEFFKFDTDYLKILEKEKNKTYLPEIQEYINKVIKHHKKYFNTFLFDEFRKLYIDIYDALKIDYDKIEVKTTFECVREIYRLISIYIVTNKEFPYQIDSELTLFNSLINRLHLNSDVYLVDAYTLARMFRQFKIVKNKISIEPRNIIFYGGLYHAENIIKILESFGFTKEIFESKLVGEEYPYCTDISSMNNKMF